MMRTMSVLVAATALRGAAAGRAAAGRDDGRADEDDAGMGMMDSMMAPMMRSMATAPERLLARRTALHLTSDQVSQLTALRDAARPVRDSAAQQAMMHLREMDEVMHGRRRTRRPCGSTSRRRSSTWAQAHMAMLDAAAQARAVLTDDQRKQVDAAATTMRRRPMTRRGGAMRHP